MILWHERYGVVTITDDRWTDATGLRWAGFVDRIGTWVALPMGCLTIFPA